MTGVRSKLTPVFLWADGALFLLPLWEKVDRRAAPRRLRGARRIAVLAKLEHPSSGALRGHLLPLGEKERRSIYGL